MNWYLAESPPRSHPSFAAVASYLRGTLHCVDAEEDEHAGNR